jgi:G3E family GTPase
MADRLLLSKCDLATRNNCRPKSRTLARLNPSAPQIDVRRGEVALASITGCGLYDPGSKTPDVAGWLAEEKVREERRKASGHHHHHHDVDRHDAHVYSFSLTFDEPLQWVFFVDAIDMLLTPSGDRILRIKGLLNVVGDHKPRVIQCVQHVNYPYTRLDDWPAEAPVQRPQESSRLHRPRSAAVAGRTAFAMFCGVSAW